MKKERNIITIDEYGRLNIPTDTANVWMTEAELAELFGTAAGAVNAGIKAIIKSDTLHDYEVCKYVRLENGNGADVYNMEVVASLAFRIRSQGATRLREYILRTLGAVNKQPAISVLMACTLKRTSVADRFPTDVFDEKNK
ncbi:hypothetical protein [Odoribacter laneus]|uniref:hypothetical protein n=1 Tax=Odoribacter laneus TaxID=626933 RepID=UPI003AF7E245